MATQIAIEGSFCRGSPGMAAPGERAPGGNDARVAPLSFEQERLWFLDQLEPGSPVYNIPRAFHLRGALEPAVLDRAIDEIVRRHESLRTTFRLVEGVPQQVVAPSLHLRTVVRDLRSLPEAGRTAEAARLASVEAATPFDLVRGPLLRILLLELGAEDCLLVITMHHIVSEGGWSMNIFVRELGVLYGAFAKGEASPLVPLPAQYADYSMWQRERMHGELLERELAYWRAQLKGAPAVLELPADRPRSAAQLYRGARAELRLPPGLSERLRTVSRREGATVAMTLLAGWAALIARYTGQEDLVIGMPIAGRGRLETEALVGFFLNTILLRVDASGDPGFAELLARVRAVALAGYDHQELPFGRVVEALRPERVSNRMPLVQVMFAPQPPPAPLALVGAEVYPHELDTGTSVVDATLFSWDEPGGIRLMLEYSAELFDPERMQRMLVHYQNLLAGALACPAQPLSELPLLTDEERYRLLVEWSAGSRDARGGECIHELVARQATMTPTATALIMDGESVTYEDLNSKANQLANHLRTVGVGPDVIVGLAAERSPEMVVGILGILKAGGAYLPLDPAYPGDRLAFMLSDSGTRLLLTQRRLVDRLPASDGVVIELDAGWETIARQSAGDPPRSAGPSDLAYVIYTSGSTGQPKGVQIPHSALVNLLVGVRDLVELSRDDTMLAVTTLSFDIAGLEIWLPLMIGARMVLVNRSAAGDGAQLAALLRDSQASVMQATPATWQLLLRSGWKDGSRLKVLCGGEALPWTLATELLATGCRLWNMYGPTETTIWSAAYPVARSPEPSDRELDVVPIGYPVANTELHVLDARRQLVPAGIPGELYIGGAGLARGYLNRAELTSERFVPHPFSSESGARLYRTGDRVCYRSDGTLDFLGRIDQQVKIRGYRIEPGEIEATLREHPAVREAVVVLRDDEGRGPALIAYVMGGATGELPLSELRDHLRQRLPTYMVPAMVIPVDEFPLTPAGKVDRRALPAPSPASMAPSDRYVAPRNEVEARLVALWERALAVAPVGVRDDFFELGGHSLLAARLFNEMEGVFGQRLPLATLFAAPTIEELAVVLQNREESSRLSSLVPIQKGGERPPLILVHGMGGNVVGYGKLAQQLGPDQPCYGLQARGLDGKTPPATRVEDMAANYVAELRAAWPRGPYALCGLSFGGTVAFEMARQLEAQGQHVALLALLDSCPTYAEWTLSGAVLRHRTAQLTSVLAYHARALGSRSPRGMLSYIRKVLQRQIGKVRSAIWRKRYELQKGRGPHAQSLPAVLRDVEESCRMAFRLYRPQPYSGRVTLFRAVIRGGDHEELEVAWQRLARGGVDVIYVPGSHLTMMSKAHVARLAETLRARLAEAFGASNAPRPTWPDEAPRAQPSGSS